MFTQLRCIALRTTKYDDRHSILSAWSVERGRIGFLIPSGASREACRRRALLMPLSLFEGVADIRPGRDLYNLRDVRPLAVLPGLSADPAKAVVAMFLAEFLEKVLRDTPPDGSLAQFVFESVVKLDSLGPRAVASFPIVFLTRLSAFFGIEPDWSAWRPGMVLDMTDGVYRATPPLSGRWLSPEESAVAVTVQRMSFETASRLRLTRILRRNILDAILQYYSMHLAPFELQSLQVVRDLL